MKAPEKIYLQVCGDCKDNDCKNCKFEDLEANVTWCKDKIFDKDIEYTRTDTFIEKALKWYCLDCECNSNCVNTKCFFYHEYERYLKGDTNAIPPKFSDSILNEDGSTSDNWRYRHFIKRMQEDFIEKACEYLEPIIFSMNAGDRPDTDKFIEELKEYLKK